MLSPVDLEQIVDEAEGAAPTSRLKLRDRALVALSCYSAISPNEIVRLRWEQIAWSTPTPSSPWCAVVHGILRRGHDTCLPVLEPASPELRALAEAAGKRSCAGPMFCSARGRSRSIAYATLRFVMRRAEERAGLGSLDDVTLKTAYAAQLKVRGLSDYEIRAALGRQTMPSVDSKLLRLRWAQGQRVVAEHRIVVPRKEELDECQLHLDIG